MASQTPASQPSSSPLTGDWGGNQIRLSLTDQGGKLELGCAAASIDTPLKPDSAGNFSAAGHYEAFATGPTAADRPPKLVPVTFTGQITENTMHLSLSNNNKSIAENYVLQRGRRVKLIRCN